jgi:hypothetical protein
VQSVTFTPAEQAEYVPQCAAPLSYVSAGTSVQPLRVAQPVKLSGTLMELRAPPPSYGTSGSAVPWNSITGMGWLGLYCAEGMSRTPATGAMAAKMSAASQPSRFDMKPPLDMPIA